MAVDARLDYVVKSDQDRLYGRLQCPQQAQIEAEAVAVVGVPAERAQGEPGGPPERASAEDSGHKGRSAGAGEIPALPEELAATFACAAAKA